MRLPLTVRAVIFAVMAPGTVAVVIPFVILQIERGTSMDVGATRFAGLVLLAAGAVVAAWCFVDFIRAGRGTPAPWDAPTRLVTRGLYRYVRNPMYVSIVTALVGESLLFRSAWLLAYAAGVWIVFHLMVRLYEEPTLERQFGASYEAYRAEVPRWIPTPPGWRRWSAP